MHERDQRLALLNTLLTTPHRDLAALHPLHRETCAADPRFYVRLAAWYAERGDVRDHKEMFVLTLCLSAFEGHRDAGLALLRRLPPYEVVRVVDFIKGRVVRRKGEQEPVREGLFANVPRSLRTEVARYLREREAEPRKFDGAVLHARKALKRLYAVLHVRPSERAQALLFDEEPPADSAAFAARAVARCADPAEQARLIVAHRLPYRVASSLVKEMTPEVVRALVRVMSPQEVINSLDMLRRKGAFDDAGVKAVVESKLEQAKTATRVSAFKAEKALEAVPVSAEVKAKLEAVADAQVKARGRIARPTALLIDKSGSMSQAIELGKRVGAMLAAVSDRELYVYAFDSIAYPVEAAGPELSAWEKALSGITAGGNTSVGVGVEMLRRKKQYVEQIVVVTDEGENAEPRFVPALLKYREELKADPAVCFVKVAGATSQLEDECKKAGVAADAYQFAGDYYALPNLVPLLARPSKLELLQEVLEYPLPQRRPA